MIKVQGKLHSIAFFGLMGTVLSGQAHALPSIIPFSISGPGISANGSLTGDFVTLSGFGDTVFVVTGASGTYSDSTDGISGTISGILPSKTYTSVPKNSNHDSVDAVGTPFPPASYDNIIYPNGDSPVVCDPAFYPFFGGQLDIYGLMLTLDLQGGGQGLVNVWSNGNLNDPSNPIGVDYGVSDGTQSNVNGNPFFTAENYVGDTGSYPNYSPSGVKFSTVPEPSSLLFIGSGLVSLPLLRLRGKIALNCILVVPIIAKI